MKLLIFITLFFGICHAQIKLPELVTDRPDQTESAVVVQQNSLQIESGVQYEKETPAESIDLAATLLRFGIYNGIELRLGTGFNLNRIEKKDDFSKTVKIQVGSKIHLFEEKDLLPEMALLTHVSFPPFGNNDTNSKIEPGFLLAMEYTLSETIGLGLNSGGDFIDGNDFVLKYSSVIGVDITESVATFLEIYGDKPADSDTNINLDSGLTWLVTPATQIDLSIGKSIQSSIDSWFINFGISSQFQNIF